MESTPPTEWGQEEAKRRLRRTKSEAVPERPVLRRTQSQPAPKKPGFEVEIDVERFTEKVKTGLSEAMSEELAQQEDVVCIMDMAMSARSSTFSQAALTERKVEVESPELAASAWIARETAHAEGRSPSPARSIISISSTKTSAIVRLPPAEDTMPDVGTQTHPPCPPPPPQSNNQENRDGSWTPINVSIEPRAMREGLVSWDSRALPYIGNGNLTLSEATGPSAANSTPERAARCRRLSAQHAHTERIRARGADLASMAGATAFDHTGRLTVFASFNPRQKRRKRVSEWREWTIHDNVDISLPDKYRCDVTDSEDGDGRVEEGKVEPRIGRSEGYRTIYSYFQPVFGHRQGVPPEWVRFEMRNGYLYVNGMQVPHLPGFEYGVGYANEETSQRMIRERERTSRQVARPVRTRSASQFGQFALQVVAGARERLQDPRNRIPGRFYCEEDGCGQSYNIEGNLRSHRRLRHGPVETYRCEECWKSFRQQSQLTRHQRIHERQRRKALVQAVCSNESAQPQESGDPVVPGTTRSSAEPLRELPFWQDNIETAQPQAAEFDGTAEEEHFGAIPTGSDSSASDDDDDNVGLRGGSLEEPRILHGPKLSYLIQMLNYSHLSKFDLSRRFNQRAHRRWRSMMKALLLHDPTPEDERWKAIWTEWREGLPRIALMPSDCIAHAEVAGAIKKIRELDLADANLSACLLGLYSAKKQTFWAVNGYIFDLLVQRFGTDKSVFTGPVLEASIRADAPDSNHDVEAIGLRGGAPDPPSVSYLLQMLKNCSVNGPEAIEPLLGRKVDELRSINLAISNHTLTEDDARWMLFWQQWREKWIENIPRPTNSWVLTTQEVAAATVVWLRNLKLEGPELDACLYGLRAADTAAAGVFWLVMGCIFELLSTTNRTNYPFRNGPAQHAPNGAGLAGVNDGAGNVGLRGGAKETPSTSQIIPMNLGSTATASDQRETFPPIGHELIYLAAFQMAESFVPDEPHPDDKYPAWKDFWCVYWHSVPGASESAMFRSAEVDATIQELEKRHLTESDLSACLVGLKLARKKTFWEVKDAIVDAILARKKVGDGIDSAAHQHVPVTGEASGGGVSVETSNSDDDAEKMGLRGGAPERHKILYLIQKRKDRSLDGQDPSRPLPRRKCEELRLLRRPIGEYKLTADHKKWTASWKNWSKSIPHATDNSTTQKEMDAVIEKLKKPDLTEPDLSACLFALYALEKRTFIAVNECIFDLLSGRMRHGVTTSTGSLQWAPTGDELPAGGALVEAPDEEEEDDRHTYTFAPQRASNTHDVRPEGRSQVMLHSRNQDAAASQPSAYMTGEVFGEGVFIQESSELTTLLRCPRSSDTASTEAAEEEAPAKIQTRAALLRILDDLSGMRRDLKTFGESLHLFITKLGMVRTRVRANFDRAGKEILYMLLGLTREELLAQAQETIGRIFVAVNYGKTRTAEDAEVCARILSLVRRARIESERISRRRYGGVSRQSRLRSGADVYYLPTEAAFQLRRQDDCMPSRRGVHEPMAIDQRPFGTCGPQKDNKTDMNTGQYDIDAVFANGRIQQRPLAMQPKQGVTVDARLSPLKYNTAMETICEPALEELIEKTCEICCGSERSCMHHEAIHNPELILAGMKEARQRNGKVSQLRGGDLKDSDAMQQLQKTASEAMQQLRKPAEQYTADGSNGMMSENNACQYDCGSNFCSTHQMYHNSNNSAFKSNVIHQPTVRSRLPNEVFTAQPLPPHAHQMQAIPPGRAPLFEQPNSQPRGPSMAWQSKTFSATNGAVGLIGQTDLCYYPDPVNSQFCTTHHIIHGRLRRPPPSSYIAQYALDETAVMAQARAVTLGSPYALDETTVMAQARALTLGFVRKGVPDVAMLQHQARVHASQYLGQNPQWTDKMQPSARSRLWAAQGGAYFGRGLQQTPASSRIAHRSQIVASFDIEWREASFTSSIDERRANGTTLVASSEAGNWELQSSPSMPSTMPSNTGKRERTPGVEADEGQRADAWASNKYSRKRTKREAFAGLERRQHQGTFAKTPSSFVNQYQYDDWEMVDAPLEFNQILENERKLMEGRTDAQDWATGMSFGDGPGTLRGGSMDDDAHDAHTHGASNSAYVSSFTHRALVDLNAIRMPTSQQPTRQFTSCIGQVEFTRSRIPGPVSPPIALEQLSLSEPQVATMGLAGVTDENQNPFSAGEIVEREEALELDTTGFDVGFEVPPLTPDYPLARRDAIWRATALRRMDEVLSTHRGRELVRSYRDGQLMSELGRRQRSTSSPIRPLSRPAPATRDNSFASVASAQVPTHTLDAMARAFGPSQQYAANPLRQPVNPPSHALLDHPFIRSANGAVQFQVPYHSPNPLRPPLQPRELSNPQVYPVFTQRASTPEARRRVAWQEIHDVASLSDIEIAVEDARRAREGLRRRQEAQRAVTPPARPRIAWGDEVDTGGSLSDLENPEEFARQSRRFRRRREALRRDRARQGAELSMFSDLSRLPRPEMSGGLALIEDDIWERNRRLAREAESAPLYLRSFVDALPSGTIGGVHGDRQAYVESLMHSTAASGHGAGERGGVPEGVWYNVTFERRLDSKPAPKRRSLKTPHASYRHDLESDDDYSGAESDEDEEYIVFSWDVQIPAGGMKDLLRSTGTEWGVKAVRARDWALEEMAREPKGEECTEAIGEWWEAVRGGASRDERCKFVGVRVLEP